jgi:hypothetical protein
MIFQAPSACKQAVPWAFTITPSTSGKGIIMLKQIVDNLKKFALVKIMRFDRKYL